MTNGGTIGPAGAKSGSVTVEQIERLKQNEGKVVKITCLDGERLEARILHVDDEYRDVMYDFVSSTTPANYPQGTACTCVISWDHIVDFE